MRETGLEIGIRQDMQFTDVSLHLRPRKHHLIYPGFTTPADNSLIKKGTHEKDFDRMTVFFQER
jgi:hypothetical protein